MKKLVVTGRYLYALALVVYGVQQFVYNDFRAVFLPAWQTSLPFLKIFAWLFGLLLIAGGVAIFIDRKGKLMSQSIATIFLALFLFVQVPFELFSDPYGNHLGSWTNAIKGLALAGGALIVAGSYVHNREYRATALAANSGRLTMIGIICFCIMLICFGIAHFLYVDFIKALIPAWMPAPAFWTLLAGGLLIACGLLMGLNIFRRQTAIFLSIMLILWIVSIHLPRAIADPNGMRGNELSSLFDAIAFTGTALLIFARR